MDELLEVTGNARQVFTGQEDFVRLAEAQANLSAADATRAQELERQRDILKALTRQYEAQKQAAQRPETVPTASQHRQHLSRLDDEKLQLGKQVAVLESEAASREVRMASARSAKAEAERTELEDDAAVDPDVFKLAIFRGLGFVPIRDDQGTYSDILVCHPTKPDVQMVSCPEGVKANPGRLWELLA